MVGAITVVSQEAAQVLESAGEGPLGKDNPNILYKKAFEAFVSFPFTVGCDLQAQKGAWDAPGIHAYTTVEIVIIFFNYTE